MSLTLSATARGVAPSATLKLNAAVAQMKSEGVPVLSLGAGEPDFDTPEHIRKAAIEALNTGKTRYTDVSGIPQLRQAIADHILAQKGLRYDARQIIVGAGAKQVLYHALQAILNPGDEVVLPSPYWVSYTEMIRMAGGVPVFVNTDPANFFLPTPEQMAAAITSRTKAMILNSPNNPSGVVYTEETLKGLAALLERKSAEYGHPIYIIADEPYRELVYGGVKVPFIPCLYKNTIVCYSYSKSLSLPGERIGYVLVPGSCADSQAVYAAVAGAARSCGHVCAPSLWQKVIARCAHLRPDLVSYDRNRQALYQGLTAMGYKMAKPDGAFYLFIQAPGGDANKFSDLAKRENLLLVPGDGFGCPGYFRICYCVSLEMIQKSLPVFEELIQEFAEK